MRSAAALLAALASSTVAKNSTKRYEYNIVMARWRRRTRLHKPAAAARVDARARAAAAVCATAEKNWSRCVALAETNRSRRAPPARGRSRRAADDAVPGRNKSFAPGARGARGARRSKIGRAGRPRFRRAVPDGPRAGLVRGRSASRVVRGRVAATPLPSRRAVPEVHEPDRSEDASLPQVGDIHDDLAAVERLRRRLRKQSRAYQMLLCTGDLTSMRHSDAAGAAKPSSVTETNAHFRRADSPRTGRGGAASTTWIFSGRRVAATPRLQRG